MTMHVPYQLVNNSALTRSSLKDAANALNALERIVYANVKHMNISSHNVQEVGFINQQNENFETSLGFSNEANNVTIMKEMSETMIEQGNISCYEISQLDWEYISNVEFWVEGVFQCIVAVAGLLGNIVSAFILLKEDMRNSFNFLLIALISMDSCYLIGAILESFRKCFYLASNAHLHLFPYFLYPGINIAVTCSIIMTVGIALERYIAVHYPIDYSQAINSPEACRRRLFKYVVPVILISTIINIPKFLESRVDSVYKNVTASAVVMSSTPVTIINESINPLLINSERMDERLEVIQNPFNATSLSPGDYEETSNDIKGYYEYSITVTALRQNPEYMIYYIYWTRLVVMGILPTILLIYFNYKIYTDIKQRNRRQMTMSTRAPNNNGEIHRRKQEDNLAIVFMGIVIIFLVCHAPRNILSLVEGMLIRNGEICRNATIELDNETMLYEFPIWVHLGTSVSHLMLVINSSTNMVLYIFLNKAFRSHFVGLVKWIIQVLGIPFRLCWNKVLQQQNNGDDENENLRMVELKVNGTEYQETMKASEQINTLTTNQVEGVISTNCPPSVLLTREEDQLLNGEKNGETAGLLRYEDKEPPEIFNKDENKEINIVQNLLCEAPAMPRKKSASINLGRPCNKIRSNANGTDLNGTTNGTQKNEEALYLKLPDESTKDNISLNTSTSNVYFSNCSVSKM